VWKPSARSRVVASLSAVWRLASKLPGRGRRDRGLQKEADRSGGREGRGRAIAAAGGTIALQAHVTNSTVYYKNIRIKMLD